MTDTSRAHSAAPASVRDARQAAVNALEGLYRLLEHVAIYPPGHPVVRLSRDRTAEAIDRALGPANALRLEAGRNVLKLGLRPLDSGRCRALGSALAELDIAVLELRKGVTAEELLELVQLLARVKANGGVEAARAAFVDPAVSPHVRVTLVDYAAIKVDEGAQEEEREEEPTVSQDPERIWNALSESILGEPDSPQTLAPEQLAGLLGDEIVFEGSGAGVLSEPLQRILAEIESLDPEARREAQARIGRFVAALPPQLREELLRIDPTLSRSGLPTDSLVTALLLGAVQSGDRPPEDAVALLNQLLRSSAGEDAGLGNLLARFSSGEAAPEELDRLGAAVSEIFRRREDIHANPEDYQALIDSLATAGAKAVASPDRWAEDLGDPRDAEGNRAHAVEIAAVQFSDRDANVHAKEALAYLRDSVDRLIDGGRLAVLEGAVSAVEAFAAAAETDTELREAADDWTRETIEESRLVRILEVAAREAGAIEPAVALVRRAGTDAADTILAVLSAGDVPAALADALEGLLAELPPELVLRYARRWADGGWSALRPLFPVLSRIESAEVQDFLVDLLEHSEEKVRGHALEALNERTLKGEHVGDILFSLLQDPSPRIVREAIRRLGAVDNPDALEPLGDFVLGRMTRRSAPPPLELRLVAIRALTLRGAPGWKCLERCLAGMGWRIRHDDRQTARTIAHALARRPADAGTDRVLRRWRWSLNGRLDALLGTRERGRKGR